MSAQAHRNNQPTANDSEWLEFPDRSEILAASVWAPDYEAEITLQRRRIAAKQVAPVTAGKGYDPRVDEAGPRTHQLDGSKVLPSEASFATVELPPGARTYSPLKEFLGKSSLDWRRLLFETLLVVSISVAIAMIALKIARPSVFSSIGTENNSADPSRPETEPTDIQTELTTSSSVEPAEISNHQTDVNDPAASAPEKTAEVEAAVEVAQEDFSVTLDPEPLTAEGSPKAAAGEIKFKTPRQTPRREARSRTRNSVSVVESNKRALTKQQPGISVKKSSAGNRAARSESVNIKSPASQTEGSRRESSLPTDPADRQQDASTSTPVTGGGQRPRTVTPKVNAVNVP